MDISMSPQKAMKLISSSFTYGKQDEGTFLAAKSYFSQFVCVKITCIGVSGYKSEVIMIGPFINAVGDQGIRSGTFIRGGAG